MEDKGKKTGFLVVFRIFTMVLCQEEDGVGKSFCSTEKTRQLAVPCGETMGLLGTARAHSANIRNQHGDAQK